MKIHSTNTNATASNLSRFAFALRRHRSSLLVSLLSLSFALFLVTVVPAQPIHAATLVGNVLGNADFETGSLSPWVKWGYPRSTVMVLNCCSHTPGTSWSAYIVPDGRYVELQQNLTVGPPTQVPLPQVIAGNPYHLQAWVYTGGLTAQVA